MSETRRDKRRRDKRQRKLRCQIILMKWFLEHPCVGCGETDVRVLEADHFEYFKKNSISRLVSESSPRKLIEELKVCESRCVKCHRKKTADGKLYGSSTTAHLKEYLKDKTCADCPESDPLLLDFDHDDPTTKSKVLKIRSRQKYGGTGTRGISKLRGDAFHEEAKKCTIRCCHCHRIRNLVETNSYRLKTIEELEKSLSDSLLSRNLNFTPIQTLAA